MTKKIKIKEAERETLQRAATMDKTKLDDKTRTAELSFSSEEPYLRYHWDIGEYYEVLSHAPGDVKLDFICSGNAPLLSDHYRDVQIGVVESAAIGADRKGRAVVRFGNKPAAKDEWEDVKDGIRSNVSVGYRVSELVLEKESENEPPTYRAKWEPLEVSLVSIPADRTVGVGRNDNQNTQKEPHTMEKTIEQIKAEAVAEERERAAKERKEREEHERLVAESRKVEADRVTGLREAGAAYNRSDDAQRFINDGKSIDEFYRWLAEDLKKAGLKPMQAVSTDLGLSAKEAKQYSFYRLVMSLKSGNVDAGFEREISDALAKRMGRAPQGAFIPPEILARDLNSTDDAALIGTAHMAGNFIEALRHRMVLAQAGITIMAGLQGNVSIPRRATAGTLYWVAEGVATTESESTFDTVSLAPKCCGTFTDITRTQQLQASPDVEMLTRKDLLDTVAQGIQVAAFHGTGANNQPTGIAATSGIGSVAGGTNGAAPDWADIISLETEVAQDNADLGNLAYITNAKVRGKLKQTFKNATYGELAVWAADNTMNGYPALCTNAVSSALTKGSTTGTCSAIFFANWADLLLGMWGVPDLLVDPYTASAAGTIRVRILQDIDLAVRHAVSFAAMLDATTT